MTFHKDIQILEKKIDHFRSIKELRAFLREKKLKLIVVIIPNQFSCVEWNITEKQVSKILDLGLRIRLSSPTNSLESVEHVPVRMEEVSWRNLDHLFEAIKQGIKNCIKSAKSNAF